LLAAGDVAEPAPAQAAAATDASQPLEVRQVRLRCALPIDVAIQVDAINNLLEALREIAAVDIKHHPSSADAQLVAVLTTLASDADIKDVLAFYVMPDAISIQSETEEEAYGFFDETLAAAAAPSTEESYGFFEEIPDASAPAASTSNASSDDSYGFFDDLPSESTPTNTDSLETPAEEAFGLFEDAPGAEGPEPEQPFVRPGDSPAALEGKGYGIYVDAPGGLGLFDDAPGAEKLLQAPAPAPYLNRATATPSKANSPSEGGRRLVDNPSIETAKAGQRATDKTVTAANTDTSIRVAVEKVDQLINLVGELVITQAMLAEAASSFDPVQAERLLAGIDLLSRNTRDMQESVMSIRMLPMSMVFSRFPRVVRDLAGKLNKQVEMKTIGDNTELDKGLIEKITDPMTHLVRNSLDHGIETPEKRIAAGKNPKGTLTLKASHQGGNVVIEVIDDGGGLNRARILEKAKEKGLPVSDNMTDFDVWQLIFAPGFSTADVVTDVSGRGVGMDVVKRNIEGLGGRVELESSPGFGTRTVIRLPLTLAILDGMSVGVGGETFIVPITTVIESLQPNMDDIRTMAGDSRMVHIRGEYLPFISLAEAFGLDGVTDITKGLLVVVEAEDGKAALFVDELLGQQQVVIKSLEANYRKVSGISGATIMGDGRVAMIVDVTAVTRMGLSNPKRRLAA
jgi:two-component system chemotaxis sensor kinase CheA